MDDNDDDHYEVQHLNKLDMKEFLLKQQEIE